MRILVTNVVLSQLSVLQVAVWMAPLVDKWPVFLRGWTTLSGPEFEVCASVAACCSVCIEGTRQFELMGSGEHAGVHMLECT